MNDTTTMVCVKDTEWKKDEIQIVESTLNMLLVDLSEVHFCCAKNSSELLEEVWDMPKIKVAVLFGTATQQGCIGGKDKAYVTNGRAIRDLPLGCAIVSTLHPLEVLKSPRSHADMLWALKRAKSIQDQPVGSDLYPKVNELFFAENSEIGAVETLQEMMDLPIGTTIACDIETTGDSTTPWYRAEILAIGMGWGGSLVYILPRAILTPPVITVIKQLMESTRFSWLWHNGIFDTHHLRRNLGISSRIDHDTMLLHYALDERHADPENPSAGHGLKQLSAKYLGLVDYDATAKITLKTGSLEQMPKEQLYQYLAYDVESTRMLFPILMAELSEEHKMEESREGYPSTMEMYSGLLLDSAKTIEDIEYCGIRVDREYLRQLDKQMGLDAKKARGECRLFADLIEQSQEKSGFNPNSPKQIAHLLYDVLRIPAPETEKTAAATLDKIKDRHPLIPAIAHFKAISKIHSTYVTGLEEQLDTSDMLHPSFLLHGTETGRLSSREPNLQNIPRTSPIKRMFVPSNGRKFIQMDYQQLEVRVAAWFSKDPNLTKACEGDIHTEVSQACFRPYHDRLTSDVHQVRAMIRSESILRELRPLLSTEATDQHLAEAVKKRYRNSAKVITFGLLYGRGAKALAEQELNCTVASAQQYVDAFWAKYPVLEEWMDEVVWNVMESGWAESPTGRRRRFPYIPESHSYRVANQAKNFPVQSFASDINLMTMNKLHRELENGRVICPVHDSILIEVDEQYVDSACCFIRDVAEHIVEDYVFPVEIEVGHNWGEMVKI